MGDEDPEEYENEADYDLENDYEQYMKEMETQFDAEEYVNNMGDTGTIEFGQPAYDTEEGGGTHMPNHLRLENTTNIPLSNNIFTIFNFTRCFFF